MNNRDARLRALPKSRNQLLDDRGDGVVWHREQRNIAQGQYFDRRPHDARIHARCERARFPSVTAVDRLNAISRAMDEASKCAADLADADDAEGWAFGHGAGVGATVPNGVAVGGGALMTMLTIHDAITELLTSNTERRN
jgi:hypothetical protein